MPKKLLHPDCWVEIPAGEFLTGLSEAQRLYTKSEYVMKEVPPLTPAWLDRYYIARFRITEHQYGLFGRGILLPKELPGHLGKAAEVQTPVVLRFCHLLGGHLPTRLQWEKAARGTDGRLYPWGNEWDPEAGFFTKFQNGTLKVDAYPKGVSPYGVWNMVGGLPELIEDPEDVTANVWTFKGLKVFVSKKGDLARKMDIADARMFYMIPRRGYGDWVTFRPVLEKWPLQQWRGAELTQSKHLKEKSAVPSPPRTRPKRTILDPDEWVKIPASEFLVGISDSQRQPIEQLLGLFDWFAEVPSQGLMWLDEFYIARFPLTLVQYKQFQANIPAYALPASCVVAEERQAANVELNQALSLCQQLGARLPTKWEWEKAARGIDGRLYPWGNEWNPKAGFFYEGQPDGVLEVDAYPEGVSPYGVWAMAGGLPELVIDTEEGLPYTFEGQALQIGLKGKHPQERQIPYAYPKIEHRYIAMVHLTFLPGYGDEFGLRMVLDQWPLQQWRGFRAGGDQADESAQKTP